MVPDPDTGKEYKTIDNGYMTIKEKIGEGSFCKVKTAILAVNREETNESGETVLIPVKQKLACKIFNRKNLKG